MLISRNLSTSFIAWTRVVLYRMLVIFIWSEMGNIWVTVSAFNHFPMVFECFYTWTSFSNNGLHLLPWTSFILDLHTLLRIIRGSVPDSATDYPCSVWGWGWVGVGVGGWMCTYNEMWCSLDWNVTFCPTCDTDVLHCLPVEWDHAPYATVLPSSWLKYISISI